jgi:hypothetical protein
MIKRENYRDNTVSIWQYIKDTIAIMHPRFWVMLESYNEAYDRDLNNALDKYDFKAIDKYTADLGGVEIWIGNYPYSSMVPYVRDCKLKIRASRRTILLAKRKLDHDLNYKSFWKD